MNDETTSTTVEAPAKPAAPAPPAAPELIAPAPPVEGSVVEAKVKKPAKSKAKAKKAKATKAATTAATADLPKAPHDDGTTALFVPSGNVQDVWADAASTFIPSLTRDLTPVQRREEVRSVMQASVRMDDKLNLIHGEMLYEVSENQYYKEWHNSETGENFKTFEEYTESELNMKKSKAHYLKQIYRIFVIELKLPTEQLRDLEWSKAKELVSVITAENAVELLDKVDSMSVKEIQAMVKQMKGVDPTTGVTAPTSDDTSLRMNFKCSSDQMDTITAALEIAKSMSASSCQTHNLDMICTDFIAGASGTGIAGVATNLDRIIMDIERAYGVKVSFDIENQAKFDAIKAADDAKATKAE